MLCDLVIPAAERDGRVCIVISSLAGHDEIAVKHLPGTTQWVACAHDRCGLLKNLVENGGERWVAVAALAEALGATSQFDPRKMQVALQFRLKTNSAPETVARVGSLMPNLQLTKLDGSVVSLADFAGQRVLINSWGSW